MKKISYKDSQKITALVLASCILYFGPLIILYNVGLEKFSLTYSIFIGITILANFIFKLED